MTAGEALVALLATAAAAVGLAAQLELAARLVSTR
jgi:hypothetical protein